MLKELLALSEQKELKKPSDRMVKKIFSAEEVRDVLREIPGTHSISIDSPSRHGSGMVHFSTKGRNFTIHIHGSTLDLLDKDNHEVAVGEKSVKDIVAAARSFKSNPILDALDFPDFPDFMESIKELELVEAVTPLSPDLSLEDTLVALEKRMAAVRRAYGLVNRLKDKDERKKHFSAITGNVNTIRAALTRAQKQLEKQQKNFERAETSYDRGEYHASHNE